MQLLAEAMVPSTQLSSFLYTAGCLTAAYPSTLIQGEGGVVLQLDDARQLLHSFQHCGGDVIRQLLEGLIQKVDNGCQLSVMDKRVALICAWELQ